MSAAILEFQRTDRQRAAAMGVSLSAYHLFCLAADDSRPLSDYAITMGITGVAICGLSDTLESKGFVTRERNLQDRRVVFLRLTPAGLERLDESQPFLEGVL